MFTNMKKYARHKRIDHKDKKEFPCGGCNQAFATNSKLVKHIQYVHEGKCKCKKCVFFEVLQHKSFGTRVLDVVLRKFS